MNSTREDPEGIGQEIASDFLYGRKSNMFKEEQQAGGSAETWNWSWGQVMSGLVNTRVLHNRGHVCRASKCSCLLLSTPVT